MTFEIKVTQIYRTERSVTLQIEAEDRESAVESVASGEIELPAFEDSRWQEGYELLSEQVE